MENGAGALEELVGQEVSSNSDSLVSPSSKSVEVTVIEPVDRWEILDLAEIRQYRDLFYFLVWRDIKVLYAQTVLGFAWAIISPAIQILIFTVIFGNVARLDSDGLPYILFSTVATVPWNFMSTAMTAASNSLVGGKQMLGKVYFPRIIFVLTPVLAKMVDFLISLVLVVVVMIWFKVVPTWNMLLLPVLMLLMMLIPSAIGLWLASLAIRFRDVRFAMGFVLSMLIYTAPVLYSSASIPDSVRPWYILNPLVGVIEGYRSALLGSDIRWDSLIVGIVMALILFLSGALYFRRMERVVVDVI